MILFDAKGPKPLAIFICCCKFELRLIVALNCFSGESFLTDLFFAKWSACSFGRLLSVLFAPAGHWLRRYGVEQVYS